MKKEKVRVDLKLEAFKKMELLHPHLVLLYVSMIGSSIIFLFMIIAFSISRPPLADFQAFQFPKAFVIGTIVLLASGLSINKVLPAYEKGDIGQLKKWLGLTFLAGLAFSCFQLIGWKELQVNQILFEGTSVSSGAYIYVISGLHAAHIVGLVFFLLKLLMETHRVSLDSVKQLVYETNPYQKVKLRILTEFWRFSGALWLVVFFYFLLTF